MGAMNQWFLCGATTLAIAGSWLGRWAGFIGSEDHVRGTRRALRRCNICRLIRSISYQM